MIVLCLGSRVCKCTCMLRSHHPVVILTVPKLLTGETSIALLFYSFGWNHPLQKMWGNIQSFVCREKNKLNIIADGHNNEGDEAEEDGHRDGERIRQPRAPSAIALVIGSTFALTVIILMGFDVFGANLYSVDTQRNVSHVSQIMSGLQYPGMVIAVLIGVHAVWDAIPRRVCMNICAWAFTIQWVHVYYWSLC